MADVSHDQPDPSAGMHDNSAMKLASTQQAVNTMGGPPQGPTQGIAGPGGTPSSQQTGTPQGGPTQPAPQDQGSGRLDMNQVFPPMPELEQQLPWRESLRNLANHPQAGPALKGLADQIKDQNGPK